MSIGADSTPHRNDLLTATEVNSETSYDFGNRLPTIAEPRPAGPTSVPVAEAALGDDVALVLADREFRSLAENIPEVLIRYDRDGRVVYTNGQYERQVHRRKLIGLFPDQTVPPSGGGAGYRDTLSEVLRTGLPSQLEFRVESPDGEMRTHSVRIQPEFHADGSVRGAIAIGHDITDLVRAHAEVAESELAFRSLSENIPDVVARYGLDGRATYINSRDQGRINGDGRLWIGKRPTEMSAPGMRGVEQYERKLLHTIATGEPDECEIEVRDIEGRERVHSVLIRAERDASGTITGAISIGRDVTDLVRARQQAAERAREFRSLADNATDFIGRWDTEARRIYANPSLVRLLGPDHDHDDDAGERTGPFEAMSHAVRRTVAQQTPQTVLQRFPGPGGSERVHEVRLVPEFDDDGAIVSVLGIGRDISEVVHQREALERAARTDLLTGVASRQMLYERAPTILASRRAVGRRAAVLLLDLDGFKQVNDQFGHRLGDRILREVGRRLGDCLPRGDLLVRLGGDEFVIVLADLECPSDAARLAHRARLAITDLRADGVRLPTFDASVGIAIFPDDGTEIDQLLAHADLALYDAKRGGRGRIEFFRPELRSAMERRSAIEDALRKCVPDLEMALELQPICTLGDEPAVWGAEALLRWRHPVLGAVRPDEFIPIAEQSGQIVALGRWVLDRAAAIAVELNRGRSQPLHVAVNVSTRQFTLDDIVDAVESAVGATGCDPRWLVVELTESLLLEDHPLVLRALGALRELGVSIAIDDFGTGYSALHYLSRLPLDHMKIDKSFLRDADTDHSQQEIVRALVAMAQALDIEVVAEGIETRGQAELLRRLGCELGQGYLLARPMPVERFTEWLPSAGTTLAAMLD